MSNLNKSFHIEGMTCASCANLIETEVGKLDFIQNVKVNFASEKVNLEFKSESDLNDHVDIVNNLATSLGYRFIDPNLKKEKNNSRELIEAIILMTIGSFFMLVMFKMNIFPFEHTTFNLIQVSISILISIYYANFYFKNFYNFITKFHSNMHTLIGMGVYTNLIYSLFLYLRNPHAHLYAEGIPYILGFTKLGQYLDHLAKTKASSSLSNLYKTQIKFAIKVKGDGTESVPVVDLVIGDIIRIKPGEKIPLNGKVVKGNSHVDESLISGESRPIVKSIENEVVAGSINIDGTLDVAITHVFKDSSIAKIINLLEEAETKKLKISILTDKIIKWFVPSIILIAIITFIVWMMLTNNLELAVNHFIAVLVIACPCALGLAVPICTMISTRNSAEEGILISGGDILEVVENINTIVFDKTGTLTEGKPQVTHVAQFGELNIQEIYSLAALSTHPLSHAITQYYQSQNLKMLDPDAFKNIVGKGFIAKFDDNEYLVGSESLLLEKNISVEKQLINKPTSKVFIAKNNQHIATYDIADEIRPTSKQLIQSLQKQNIEIWLLTGDNQEIANEISEQLGIKNIVAKCSPQDKSNYIQKFKNEGKVVMMVGDGINDAVALSTANVSVAMANGSDIAISAANITVLDDNISNLSDFILNSKNTMSRVRENLFLSMIYNIIFIPVAAGVFAFNLEPKYAAIAMGGSSLSVILNSLRLKK